MRRLLLIALMCLLPFQWSWAAAASVCAHESVSEVAHFGHHEHQHTGAASTPDVGGDDHDASPSYHADCGACHGFGAPLVASFAAVGAPCPAHLAHADFDVPVPHRALDTLLRPPLAFVG